MNNLLTLPIKNNRALSLIETIFLSILFHVAFLFYIPSLNLENITTSTELDVDIFINEPEPIKEVLPEIKSIKRIEPIPIKEIVKPEQIEPIIKPEKIAQPEKIARPEKIAQPEVTKSVSPSVIKKSIESYSSTLAKAIAKQKKYPRIAQLRGWQGEMIIDLKIDGQGNLIESKIKKGTKFKVLDTEGMNMVKRASPFPKPPKNLESSVFNVIVPISFKLKQ